MQAARHHAFDGAIGPDGHEDGGLHHAMVQRQGASAGVAGGVGFEQIELEHGKFEKVGFSFSVVVCV
jgi:hypothetical protein